MIFLIINCPNFVYLLVDSGFLPPPQPLKFLWRICSSFPHWMDQPGRTIGQSDKRACLFVRFCQMELDTSMASACIAVSCMLPLRIIIIIIIIMPINVQNCSLYATRGWAALHIRKQQNIKKKSEILRCSTSSLMCQRSSQLTNKALKPEDSVILPFADICCFDDAVN